MSKLLIITQRVNAEDQLLGFFLDWIREFSVHFEKVTILCLEKGKFNLPQNVEVRSLGKDEGHGKLRQLLNFYFLIFNLDKNYDAVFVHMNPIWVCLGSWFWHLKRKKVSVWYAHKSVTFKLKMAEKFADVIYASTPEGFRIHSNKLMITGQGINVDLFKPDSQFTTNSSQLTILSVGRIAPIKNYESLIEAVKIMKDEGMNPTVSIIGEPGLKADFEYEKKLKNMVKNTGLETNITFLGKVHNQDLPAYYRKNKLYVNLSNTGSLDKTILEAMASGCTVLSSNDSAKAFLPARLIIKETESRMLAKQLKEASGWDFGQELRQYVVNNHSVSRLIKIISDSLKS